MLGWRISRYDRSRPRFLCSSATIANPVELAQAVCGCPFSLVDRDGSPAPEKSYHIWQPPIVDLDYRVPPTEEAALLIPHLVTARRSFIASEDPQGCRSVILKARGQAPQRRTARQDEEAGSRIPVGYLPEERKESNERWCPDSCRGWFVDQRMELGSTSRASSVPWLTDLRARRASSGSSPGDPAAPRGLGRPT
jgi:DEAD/DEAH box helicase domain-containing protein